MEERKRNKRGSEEGGKETKNRNGAKVRAVCILPSFHPSLHSSLLWHASLVVMCMYVCVRVCARQSPLIPLSSWSHYSPPPIRSTFLIFLHRWQKDETEGCSGGGGGVRGEVGFVEGSTVISSRRRFCLISGTFTSAVICVVQIFIIFFLKRVFSHLHVCVDT